MAGLTDAPRIQRVHPSGVLPAALAGAPRLAFGRPALWPITLVGFLARGGIVLLWLPILALPGPVGLATLVGPDLLDANGVSGRVQVLLTIAALGVTAMIWLALIVSAAADAAAFERVVDDPDGPSAPIGPSGSSAPRPASRAWLIVQLALLQALLLLPAALALVPATVALVDAARQEVLVPTHLDVPLVLRVLEGAAQPLLVVLLLAVVGESLYARLAREVLLARRERSLRPGQGDSLGGVAARGLARLVRRPLPHLMAELVGWAAIGAALLLGIGALTATWPLVRAAYLPGSGAAGTALGAGIGLGLQLLVTVALVLVLGIVLTVLGAATAVRSALLTAAALQGRAVEGWTDGRD
jgi:hypothetical protein